MAEEQLIAVPGTFGENGNFIIEREIGRGGMGGVYMGRDKMLDRPVAVKVMLREYGADANFLERFKREAQSAARLIHPNIAQIYSYGVCDGMPYMAMELVPGGSLYTIMEANPGKTDIQRMLKIAEQVAQALQCAADQGLVHGDVKPENVLLDASGNAKLVDFGLAGMKNTDEIWGTPYYISPEKVNKQAVDFKADMYSLGGTLYHALTGVAPFEGEDAVAVVKKRFEGMPKKPSEVRPEITPAVDALVMKMLAMDKDERYPSFEALIQAIKDVLTNGLTAKAAESAAKAAAPAGGTTAMRRPASTAAARRMAIRRKGMASAAMKAKVDEDPDLKQSEDEEGGSLGLKVALFVVGGILLIGGVIGGLVWYQIADKKAREAEYRQQLESKRSEAHESIAKTRIAAEKFDAEFKAFAAEATTSCESVTDELKKLMPDWADQFKPAISEELKKAIAATNVQTKAESEGKSTTNNVAKASAKSVKTYASVQEEAKAYGIEVPEGEIDPASPDGEEFYKKLKEARAKAREAAAAQKKDEKEAATKQEKAAEAAPVKKPPAVMVDIHELWERAYTCQACQIRIAEAVKKVIAECDKEKEITGDDEDSLRKLGDLTSTAKDLYEQIVASKDVETVRKGISFIKSKGRKVVDSTVKRLRIEKLEAQRKAQAEARAEAEKKQKEEAAAAKAALIERECTEIREKFNTIAGQGAFRQLDWKGAIRQLTVASEDFKSAEGQIAAQFEIRKVNMMKKVQDILIKNLKGHIFRGKLKGAKVLDANERELQILKADGKTKQKILWQTFYKDYPGNFNEVINHYIVNGKKNASLSLKDQSEAMLGAALTMKLVCSETNGAVGRAKELAEKVVKDFSDMEKTVKAIFPEAEVSNANSDE